MDCCKLEGCDCLHHIISNSTGSVPQDRQRGGCRLCVDLWVRIWPARLLRPLLACSRTSEQLEATPVTLRRAPWPPERLQWLGELIGRSVFATVGKHALRKFRQLKTANFGSPGTRSHAAQNGRHRSKQGRFQTGVEITVSFTECVRITWESVRSAIAAIASAIAASMHDPRRAAAAAGAGANIALASGSSAPPGDSKRRTLGG